MLPVLLGLALSADGYLDHGKNVSLRMRFTPLDYKIHSATTCWLLSEYTHGGVTAARARTAKGVQAQHAGESVARLGMLKCGLEPVLLMSRNKRRYLNLALSM